MTHRRLHLVCFISVGLYLAASPHAALAQSALGITNLKTEYKVNPIGIDATRPRFSWQLTSASRAQVQRSYQVLVASSQANIDANVGDKWDSGQVTSDKSNQIEYNGSALASRLRYYWKVRVWDGGNVASAWSGSAFFEMGLLSAGDWTARWIAEPTVTDKSPLMRKGFSVGNTVRRARVYATALGAYEIYINGQRVSQDYFNPGWTVYTKRVPYQAYDVTSLIVSGNNAIGAVVGNGWYASDGWIHTPVAGTTRSVRVQLEIELTDNTTQRIISDTSWRVWADGPIQSSWIYDGEVYDARKEIAGWSTGSFVDSSWALARDVSTYGGALVAGSFPIRVMQNQTPIAITSPAAGTYIFDMGQNMVGWARLSVQGASGTTVRMRHGEMLSPNGTLYVDNLRGAAQTDTFILRGTGGVEVFEPHFTYHGFRYLEITGFPGTPALGAITGRVAYAALDNTGSLTTSNAQLNKLYQNIVWGQRGNFYSVPTDCPQRDERMGWTGDGQVFAGAAALNMDVSSYYSKWAQDIEDDQGGDGVYPVTVPVASLPSAPSPAWQEVGVVLPWTVYQAYGDTRIINQRWASMVRFISYMQSHATNNLQAAGGYGDWLSAGENVPGEILATAYYGYSVKMMAAMARATGRTAEATSYDTLFGNIRNAFTNAYVGIDGQVMGGTQAGYAMAIAMDMLPGDRVAGAGRYLASNVRARGNHLTTGFVGTKDLNDALTKAGQTPVAYDLINQTSYPSWLFSIQNGATTIWERWDGWTPTAGFQDPGMNSFNHYSFGAVGKWMFNSIAGIGIDPLKPGYKGIIIRPQPGGALTTTRGEYKSIYGSIISDWRVAGSTLTLGLTIPVNTTATLYLPTRNSSTVTEGGVSAGSAAGVTFLGMDGNAAIYSVGSGTYSFTSDMTGTGPTPVPTGAPGTWTACASEAGTCTFSGTRQVRYGANGAYSYGTFTSSVVCSNGVFGDPAPNVAKTCDYNNATVTPTPVPPAGPWTLCANEFGTCSFTGTRLVRYGANGLYATGTFTGSVLCTNDVFGDPTPLVAKTCEYNNSGSSATPTATASPAVTPTATATPTPTAGGTNLAQGKPASASSIEAAGYEAGLAVDGNAGTRWASAFADPQWIMVDLGAATSITRVRLNWEAAFGKSYQIQTSADNVNWTTIYTTTTGVGGIEDLTVSGNGRYVRMYGTVRGTGYGYSLWEFEVYGGAAATPTATSRPTATATATARATSTPTATARATATPTATARPTPTATASGGPSGYTFCSNENATCTFTGTQSIAFGASSAFNFRNAASSIACNNATFGDPIANTVKACYVSLLPPGNGWTQCATENGTCSFSGTHPVAYGANGAFNERMATTSVACNNATFGDPISGTAKACYYK